MIVIRNLTPHPLTLCGSNGAPFDAISPESVPARVAMVRSHEGTIALPPSTLLAEQPDWVSGLDVDPTTGSVAFPTVTVRLAPEIDGLPAAAPGVIMVVSRMVCEAAPGRNDLYYPEDVVRQDGVIIGCRTLGRVGPGANR